MGVKADRLEGESDDLMALDESMERESTGVSRHPTWSAPISHVRLHWESFDEASDSDTWDETSHPTWDSACDAPVVREAAIEAETESDEGDAARLVSLATRMSVGDAMDPVFVVRPGARLSDLAERLRDEDVIVADRNGVPLGVVQRGEREPTKARAGEVMEPIGTLEKTDRLSKALGLMAAQGIPSMCVVSCEQCVVGLIYANRALSRLFAAARRSGPRSARF